MKKVLLTSVATLALVAGSLSPVEAYYKDNAGTEYQTLTNVSQAQYGQLLTEISGKIATVRGQIPAATTAVRTAEATLKAAQEKYEETSAEYKKAKAEYEKAVKALEEAKIEEAAAKQALNELTAVYGEYTKAVQALQETKQRKIDEAAQVRATEVAQAETISSASVIAYNEALAAYNTAVQRVAEASANPEFPKDGLAELQAQVQTALTNKTAAENTMNQKVIEQTNAVNAATSKESKAVSAANAEYTTLFADLNRKYNTTDIYGMKAEIEKAKSRLTKATAAVATAQSDLTAARTKLGQADTANKAAKQALTTAQINVANKKAELAKLYNEKAYLENNLHELVVGSKANSTDPSRINLNKEQQEIVKEITGKDSKELKDAAEKAKAELDKAIKERDALRKESSEADSDSETTEGETSKEETSKEETSKQGTSKESDKKSDKKSKEAKLPETGENSGLAIYGAAALAILASVGLVAKRKDENA